MELGAVILPDQTAIVVKAVTKSEARTAAKVSFRIPRKGRLPVGTVVRQLHFSDVPSSPELQAEAVTTH